MNRNYFVIRNALSNWFPRPTHVGLSISIDDPLIIKYRMTLGSIYYNSRKKEIIMDLPKDPQINNIDLVMDFLQKGYPRIFMLWQQVKKDTEGHLKYVANLWTKRLLHEVDSIISILTTKYPILVSYDDFKTSENIYVRNNIIEGLYKEIEHIALTGNEIGLFQFNPSGSKVGNAFLFLQSSNDRILNEFMNLITKVLHDEDTIDEFRNAEVKKAEIESKVLDFKQELQNITNSMR